MSSESEFRSEEQSGENIQYPVPLCEIVERGAASVHSGVHKVHEVHNIHRQVPVKAGCWSYEAMSPINNPGSSRSMPVFCPLDAALNKDMFF